MLNYNHTFKITCGCFAFTTITIIEYLLVTTMKSLFLEQYIILQTILERASMFLAMNLNEDKE
jgi:hypothetical protein